MAESAQINDLIAASLLADPELVEEYADRAPRRRDQPAERSERPREPTRPSSSGRMAPEQQRNSKARQLGMQRPRTPSPPRNRERPRAAHVPSLKSSSEDQPASRPRPTVASAPSKSRPPVPVIKAVYKAASAKSASKVVPPEAEPWVELGTSQASPVKPNHASGPPIGAKTSRDSEHREPSGKPAPPWVTTSSSSGTAQSKTRQPSAPPPGVATETSPPWSTGNSDDRGSNATRASAGKGTPVTPHPTVAKGGKGKGGSKGSERAGSADATVKRALCKFHLEGRCERGEACLFAHTEAEIGDKNSPGTGGNAVKRQQSPQREPNGPKAKAPKLLRKVNGQQTQDSTPAAPWHSSEGNVQQKQDSTPMAPWQPKDSSEGNVKQKKGSASAAPWRPKDGDDDVASDIGAKIHELKNKGIELDADALGALFKVQAKVACEVLTGALYAGANASKFVTTAIARKTAVTSSARDGPPQTPWSKNAPPQTPWSKPDEAQSKVHPVLKKWSKPDDGLSKVHPVLKKHFR